MATLQSDAAKNGFSPIADEAGDIVCIRSVFAVVAAPALNDVIEMATVPADMLPVDFTLDLDDLDTAAGLVLDGGWISGLPGDLVTARTCGQEFFAGSTLGQTGGVLRAAIASAFRQVAAPVDRSFGLKIATAATTPIVGSLAGLTNKGAWTPGTAYALNDYVTLPNGVVMYVTTAGTSAVYGTDRLSPAQYEPRWLLGKGLTTADNSVVWTCQTPIIGLSLFLRPSIRNF